jgi:pyranose oxidase
MNTEHVDILIVGSGPVGSTFARLLTDGSPKSKVLLIDAGPRLTERAGLHVKNIADPTARAAAQVASQGPTAYPYSTPTVAQRANASEASGPQRTSLFARPGTFLLDGEDQAGMPAAAMSANVGGMGSHWTCACPRPGNTERIPFIPIEEWNGLCDVAEGLLRVTRNAYPTSPAQTAIQHLLGKVFDPSLPSDRPVGTMPLACTVTPQGDRSWSGPDVILGPLAEGHTAPSNFELRSRNVCVRLEFGDAGVTSAIVMDLSTKLLTRIVARKYIVAADALRTPQLLWASGLRLRALGHYLNDQPQSIGLVELSDDAIAAAVKSLPSGHEKERVGAPGQSQADLTMGVLWVPFHDPTHPFHGQVMHLDASPISLEVSGKSSNQGNYVGLGWFCAKDVQFDDRLEFSEDEKDFFSLPRMRIQYRLTSTDEERLRASLTEQKRAADAFGSFVKGGEPRTLAAGSSLHYQGSVRMGQIDDGESVCDPFAQVWGTDNLFVGSNGVIPTSTACNPTMSAVALAVRSCRRILESLR